MLLTCFNPQSFVYCFLILVQARLHFFFQPLHIILFLENGLHIIDEWVDSFLMLRIQITAGGSNQLRRQLALQYCFNIAFHWVLYALCLRTVFEGVDCLLVVACVWRNTSDHHSLWVPSQGILENSSEFWVSKRDKGRLFLFRKDVDALSQRE